ncbi:MAG: hypothetical protein M3Z00_08155 [Actinomycetota bacterium]|nr:hypothetical protein [Actinomycetota bacterium]
MGTETSSQRWRLPAPGIARVAAGPTIGCLLVLGLYGALPGQLPDAAAAMGGLTTCVGENFLGNLVRCHAVGYPASAETAFGLPYNLLAGLLQALGADLATATRLVWAGTLVLGLWGCRRLLDRFTEVHWIAWVGAFAFVVAPIVSGQAGYGPLQLGFILTPCYLLIDVRFLESLSAALGPKRIVRRGIAVLVVRIVALLLDPYSFVIATLLIGIVYLFWLVDQLRARSFGPAAVAAVTLALTGAVAYLLYTSSASVAGLTPMTIDFFRGQGVDIVPQLVPAGSLWWSRLTGLQLSILPINAYSDGHNLSDVFVGYVLLTLAVGGFILALRTRGSAACWRGIVVGGAACGLLALGPSLKIGDFRNVAEPAKIRAADYLMPKDAATATTPWSRLYSWLPGVDQMRALYRWELGVRIALVVLAVMALCWLARRGGRWRVVAVVAAGLLVAEAVPSVPDRISATRRSLATVRGIQQDLIDPLRQYTKPGDRVVLYGPGGVSQGANDYLANTVCPGLQIRCYNVGGDKAAADVVKAYPPAARRVVAQHGVRSDAENQRDLAAMFRADQLDAVVLVNFDLRWQAYSWPGPPAERERAAAAAATMFTGPRYVRKVGTWFTVVTTARPPD